MTGRCYRFSLSARIQIKPTSERSSSPALLRCSMLPVRHIAIPQDRKGSNKSRLSSIRLGFGVHGFPMAQSPDGMSGPGAAAARSLARFCSGNVTEKLLLVALRRFLEVARFEFRARRPDWLDDITRRLRDDPSRRVPELARLAGLHPSWLGTAYRRATGEGLMNTTARFRVERAAQLLRETDLPLAYIATDAGFCDQSHMIRTFRRVLGRLPSAVREDKDHFRQMPDMR